jgi:S-ribosylhomocysteine lyase LuxS involved in autoinducer biosynthesis
MVEYRIRKKSIRVGSDDPLLVTMRVMHGMKFCRCGRPMARIEFNPMGCKTRVFYLCVVCGVEDYDKIK